jgi:hypothetical protein
MIMSCGSRRATNGGYAYVVAPGEFKERSALRAASGGFTAKSDNRTFLENATWRAISPSVASWLDRRLWLWWWKWQDRERLWRRKPELRREFL